MALNLKLALFLIELAWCLAAWWVYDRENRRLLVTSLVLMALYTNTVFGYAPPPEPPQAVGAIGMMAQFLVTTALVFWAARSSERQSATVVRSRTRVRSA